MDPGKRRQAKRASAEQAGLTRAFCRDRTVSVTWHLGGVLPPLFTTAVAAFRVAESQALNTSRPNLTARRAPALRAGTASAHKTRTPSALQARVLRVRSDG